MEELENSPITEMAFREYIADQSWRKNWNKVATITMNELWEELMIAKKS